MLNQKPTTTELVPTTANALAQEHKLDLSSTLPARYGYGYDVNDTDEANTAFARVQEYWFAVRKRIWLVVGLMIVSTLLAAVYVARQPDIFESSARIQVDAEMNSPAMNASKSNTFTLYTGQQDPTYFNTQMQLLTSAGLLRRVAKTLDLENSKGFSTPQNMPQPSTVERLKTMIGLGQPKPIPNGGKITSDTIAPGDIAPQTARDDVREINQYAPFVEAMQGALSIEEVKDTRIIVVKYRHLDPSLAAKVTNTIADTLVLSNLERRTQTSSSAGDFFQQRIAQLQNEIRSGEERLNNYSRTHQITSLDPAQNPIVERMTALNRQLLIAENEKKVAGARLAAAQQPGAADALASGVNKEVEDIQSELNKLRQEREQLLVEYTEKYPQVQEVNQKIGVLEKRLKESRSQASGNLTKNLETSYRQAAQNEAELREEYSRAQAETMNQNEAAVNYRIMQQGIETNKEMLNNMLQQEKANDMVLAGTPNNINVVDYAPTPKGPVGPKRFQGITLAALMSLVIGVALARYLEYLDDTIHSVEDVEKALRLPALALIPASDNAHGRRNWFSFVTPKNRLQRGSNEAIAAKELILRQDARSPVAEAYRQLRTSILLSSAGGAPKSLLVTSSQPSEGKTTTVVNTATVLAQTGAAVLVIDADLRRPRLHSVFSKTNNVGLSTILASRVEDAEIFAAIQRDEESGLYILPSGPVPPNPAELLGSERMQRLMKVLSARFAHIIIDSPPVASFTDGVLISAMTDGVLLVVHGGKTSRMIIRRSRQLLSDVNAKIFGVVLNNVDLKSGNNYYYQHYYQSYYADDELAHETI